MRDWGFVWFTLAFCAFAVFVSVVVLPALASDSRARKAAADVGIENPRVISSGPAWGVLGGCTQSDLVKFKVRGTRGGRPVTVKVCAVVPFGGYTVRS